MTMTFFPEKFSYVDACHPHPPNTQYRIGVGVENWNGTFVPVYKIQMVYDGKVSGRKSPSYPVNSNDFIKVHTELLKLIDSIKNEKQYEKEVEVIK
ncbi:hypothetical protein [Bacillus atrophaeus]|uniref:hypothetical protein n=1 Tax=Bacillus atrophaeus TaxID=1452 RepID=UPI00387331BB